MKYETVWITGEVQKADGTDFDEADVDVFQAAFSEWLEDMGWGFGGGIGPGEPAAAGQGEKGPE